MLAYSERIQLLILTERELAQVNEERQIDWISLQEPHEPDSGLEEESQVVLYYSQMVIKLCERLSFEKNKPYSYCQFACIAVQLFKRYFLRWSIVKCKNIQQIQLLCIFMAMKLQNFHTYQIKENISKKEKYLRMHPWEDCVLLGDVNYAEVEKKFIESLRFNFNVDSLLISIESLLSHIVEVNKDLKLEKKVYDLSKLILLDSSLIFQYDQQTLGLGCVLQVLDKENLSRDIYLPNEICKLISSQSSVFMPLLLKISHLESPNEKQLDNMANLFKEAKKNQATNNNSTRNFKKPERISRASTTQPSTHVNTISTHSENKQPNKPNSATSTASSIHPIPNNQNNNAVIHHNSTNSQGSTHPSIQGHSDKLIGQGVNQPQVQPAPSKYAVLTHAVGLDSNQNSNNNSNRRSSSSAIEIEQPIVSNNSNKPSQPSISSSQKHVSQGADIHNKNPSITPTKQNNSAHPATSTPNKSNSTSQHQSDNSHPTSSNCAPPSKLSISTSPSSVVAPITGLASNPQAFITKSKEQIIGASAFPSENPSRLSQPSKSSANCVTEKPISQHGSPQRDQTKSPLRLSTPVKSSTSTNNSSYPQQQPRDKSSKQQSSSSQSSSRGERTPQGKEERISSSNQERSRTPSKKESSHTSSSQNHWKSNEKSSSKGARASSPNDDYDESMELESNYLRSLGSLSQLISDGTTSESAILGLAQQSQSLSKIQLEVSDKMQQEKELDPSREATSSNISPNKGSSSKDYDERHRSEREEKGIYRSDRDRDDRSNRQKRDRDFERPKERKRTYESDKRDKYGDKDDRDCYSSSSSSYHRESSRDKKDKCKESRDRDYDRDYNDRESRDYRDSKDFKKDRDRDYKDKERDRDYKDRDKKDRYRDKQRDKSDSRDREIRDRKDRDYKDNRERKDSRDYRDSSSKDSKDYKESRDKERNRSDQYSSSSSAQKDKEEFRRNSEKDKRNEVSYSSEGEIKRKDSQTIIDDTRNKTEASDDNKQINN